MVELSGTDIIQFLLLVIVVLLQIIFGSKMRKNNKQSNDDTTLTGNPGPAESIPGKAQACINHGISLGKIETKVNGLCTQMNRLLNSKK